jgi:HD superfamily phosphohydrolase
MAAREKTTVIRDPVHGYVRVAPHERLVIDHPITQRLRHVLQTGLAHLTFPEARTSRFSHSLGTMHLASRFLVACLENAGSRVAQAFFDAVSKLPHLRDGMIRLEEMDSLWAPAEPGTQIGFMSARAVFPGRHSPEEERHRRRLLAFVEAGLRLAALFHDLGHLPFSHDLEIALDRYARQMKREHRPLPAGMNEVLAGDLPPHEQIGHRLSELVLKSLVGPQTQPVLRAVYRLAKDILNAKVLYVNEERPNAKVLPWLHSLIDGEVDVDRGDYLLRDGRALGFEFAAYDLERLIDHLVLVREDGLGFATAIREAGLSALETFFVSRSRSNLAMVRHHKNAQAGAAFRFASVAAFDTAMGRQFLEALGALFAPDLDQSDEVGRRLESFARFDDTFWVQALRAIPQEGRSAMLDACLDLVLSRGSQLRSLWKRKGDVPGDKLARLNNLLASEDPRDGGMLDSRMKELEEQGVLFIRHAFTPFRIFKHRPDDEGADRSTYSVMLVRTERRGLQPAARMSPHISALYQSWREDPHVHAFALRNSPLDAAKVLDWLLDGAPVRKRARRPAK